MVSVYVPGGTPVMVNSELSLHGPAKTAAFPFSVSLNPTQALTTGRPSSRPGWRGGRFPWTDTTRPFTVAPGAGQPVTGQMNFGP